MPHTFAPRAGTRASRAAAAVLLALGTACSDDVDILRPDAEPLDPMFASYVALGNSITAGFQSGGINDSTQREAYPVLLARAMRTDFRIPTLAGNGCPPPIADILTGARVGGSPDASQCALRDAGAVGDYWHNVAVPGARALDPFSESTPSSNLLTTLILGGKTQVARALDANPTFVSIWIGNNDVLQAASTGVLEPVEGVSPGMTPVTTFAERFEQTVDQLLAGAPGLEGVALGVVQVQLAPLFFPAPALLDPAFKNGFDQYAGVETTIHPSCTPASTSLISFAIVQQIRGGGHPPVIACERGVVENPLVGDVFVLDAAEQQVLQDAVNAYNAAIRTKAEEVGWAYADPNVPLLALRSTGEIPAVPDLANPGALFGAYISLDGAHPAGPAHVAVANLLIGVINEHYGTNLQAVSGAPTGGG